MYNPMSSMGAPQQFSPVAFSTLPPEAFSDSPPAGPPPLPMDARGGLFQQATSPQRSGAVLPPRGPRDTQQLRPPAALAGAPLIPGVPNVVLGVGAAALVWFFFIRK